MRDVLTRERCSAPKATTAGINAVGGGLVVVQFERVPKERPR
jgi:hypothetical protein